jgi:hypothetical protein
MFFKTSDEISAITGSYYKNNNFTKVLPFLETTKIKLAKIIGEDTVEKAETIYTSTTQSDDEKTLLLMIQRPVAILGTLELYRHNDISHEDNGRKFKIDSDKEKLPWEWQLQRDDDIQLNDYYDAVDDLLAYLEGKKTDTWLVQKTRIGYKKLLIQDSETFSHYWDIDSPRIFMQLAPLMCEAQRMWLIPAYGKDDFDALLLDVQNDKADSNDEYVYAANALVLYTMYLAFKRGMYSIIPQGVVQRNLQSDGMYKGESITYSMVNKYAESLHRDADKMLDKMKTVKNGNPVYDLLPDNDKNNKYMIL